MKKICSILILIVLLLNSSVMVLISEAVEAVSSMISDAQENIQTTQEIVLEKYINYANEVEQGTMIQLKVGVGLQKETTEEVYLEGTTVTIECPKILDRIPTRVEVVGKESSYENGIITIQEKYEEKLKYEEKQEYTVIIFYDADCYTNTNQERLINVKVSVTETIQKANAEGSITLKGETTAQGTVTENVGTIVSVDYELDTVYNGYINSNIQNGTAYNTEYEEKAKIMISNKNIAETFTIASNNSFSFQEVEILNNNNLVYKNIIIEKSKIEDILGDRGEILILNANNEIVDLINNEVEADENGNYVYTFAEPVENIKLQICNIVKEGIIEFNTTKVIKSTLAQSVDTIKNKLNISGTKTKQITTLDEATQEEVISEETNIVYAENLENNIAIQEAKETISMSVNKQELTNKSQNELTITATLERNSSSNKLFENPTVFIELPEEVEKIILNDVQILHDTELTKQEAVVETNAEGKQVIRITLTGKQTQYIQSEDVSKGTNILISATVMLKQNITTKTSSIKMICNEATYEQPINLIERNQMIATMSLTPEVEGTVVNSNGLKIDTKVIAGDKVLANNETIYEEQILKYQVTLTNTTNSNINNIKIVGQIPDGMTYVDLVEGTFYCENYEFVPNETIKQKEITVGTLQAGQTETYYYEVKVNDLLDTEEEKEIISEVKVYIGENSISTYTLTSVISQAELAVEFGGFIDRGERSRWIYYARVSNISSIDQQNINISIPFPEKIQIESFNIWDIDETNHEAHVENNIISVKINSLEKINEEDTPTLGIPDSNGEYGNIGLEIKDNQIIVLITANIVDIKENEDYSWQIDTAATVTSQTGKVYKSNENRAYGYIEAIQVTQTSDKSGEVLQKEDEISYIFTVENIGKIVDEWGGYTSVNFKDYIPNELEVISVEYNSNKVSRTIVDSQYTYTIEPFTRALSDYEIQLINQNDNTDSARVSLNLNIKQNEAITITIKAKARTIYNNDADISNYAIVTGEYINTKQSNVIQNTIKAKSTVTDIGDVVNPKPTIDPDDSDNPMNPENPETKTYTISGIAWVDENENGQREETEHKLSGIEVMLLDITNNRYIQDGNGNIITKVTNSYGQYSFENISEGKYYVIFKYNNDDYEITTYQKPGINASMNSDAMPKVATLNGETISIGLTDIIDLTSNKANIDLGLIKNKIFDLKVDKYIQKITVQNSAGTKEYTYDNKKIAKVEIPEKQIAGSTLVIEYKIVVTNVGELAGTVNELIDEMPDSLEFNSELNSNWYKTVGKNLSNTNISTKEIQPGESIETTLVLTKTLDETIQTYTNTAKIGISDNAKHIADKNIENNSDKVEVIVSIQTGSTGEYIGTVLGTILIITALVIVVVVLTKNNKGKTLKILCFILVTFLALHVKTEIVADGEIWIPVVLGTTNIEVISYKTKDYVSKGTGHPTTCNTPGAHLCSDDTFEMTKAGIPEGDPYDYQVQGSDVHLDKNDVGIVQFKRIGDCDIYGPFQVSYSGSISLKVEGITDINGEPSSISYKVVDETGINEIGISSGTTFYISVSSSVKALTNVSVTASETKTVSYYVNIHWMIAYKCIEVPNDETHKKISADDVQFHTEEYYEEMKFTETTSVSKTVTWDLPKTLIIEKLDYDDKANEIRTPLPDIKLILKYETSDGVRYVKQNEEDLSITYVIDEADATTFITDKDGYVLVEGLKLGKYTFIETENPYYGYQNIKNINDIRTGTIGEDTPIARCTILNRKLVGNINIEKVNSADSSVKLSGVEFVLLGDLTDYTENPDNPDVVRQYIKVEVMGKEGFQSGEDNKLYGSVYITKQEYTDKIEEATIFVTDENGQLNINNLALQSRYTELYREVTDPKDPTKKVEDPLDRAYYGIIEIKNPYYGYELDKDYIQWETNLDYPEIQEVPGEYDGYETMIYIIPKNQEDTNITVSNEQKYVRISGYVWEDLTAGKDNTRNDLYQDPNKENDPDKLVEGIKVILHNKKTGNSYERWTDSNGAYLFGGQNEDGTYLEDNILLRDIDDYYVEFIYNGMKYANVLSNTEKDNGSKAIEGTNRTTFNNNYATVIGNTTKESSGETQGQLLNADGKITADVYYTQPSEYQSQITYTEGQQYADISKGIILNDYYAVDKYHISATTLATGYNLKKTFVTGSTEEIKNINLGIYEREQIDLAVSSDIEDINVALNGYTHTYHYATRNQYVKNDTAFNIGVKFGDKYLNRYTRTIYQSAVSYFAEDKDNNKVEVNVIYKIAMKNQSTDQLTAVFNQINNYYDKEYTPQEVYYMSGTTKIPITDWSIGSQKYANGELNVLQINLTDRLSGGTSSTIYIRYKVSDEAVLGLLNGDATLDNMTEISSYSTFSTLTGEHYASVDENSAPGNVAVQLDNNNKFIQTTFEDDTDKAPSLVLQADKNNVISGTVFEDSQTEASKNQNERLGNGIYEENTENVVVNAKVELLEVYDDNDDVSSNLKGTIKYDSSGNPIVATLYQVIQGENGEIKQQLVKAETYTDNNGNYQFVGMIPDGYVVRYTYGQGTKIKDIGTGNYKDIEVRDYKSTIIKSSTIATALNIQPATATIEGRGNYNWNTIEEKDANGNIIRYSDAVDEIIERMKQEQEDNVLNYGTIQNAIETQNYDMKARTASFIVGVEFENINSASNVYLRDINGNMVVDDNGDPIPDPNLYSENKNIDFGIILRPIVELVLDKNLTNMSIQLANGQMLVNGNPYEQDLPYTRAVEDNIYVEMDTDLIQGAALNMEYEIKLINNSEVDYKFTNLSSSDSVSIAGRRYYYFGDSTGAEKVDKYVKLVGDYLDGELVYDINEINEGLEEGWEIKTAEKLYEEGRISKETRDALIEGQHNIFVTTEFNEGLETSSNPNRATSKTVKVHVSKLLGAKDELVFTNDAEILEIYAIARTTGLEATPGNLMPQRAVEKDEDSVKLVILPPTGSNEHISYIAYIVTGIGSLLLIIAGIIIIKKKMWR